jgi:choline-sulfatase
MPQTTPTNVLILCSDEHTKRVLGCYGNPVVRTPNLDALAVRGTRFTSAYTPFPICVPARACLATGRYAHQLGIWDNGAPYTGREAPSWGHRLTAQGHQVTTIGKLHYRSEGDDTGFPDQRLPMHVVDGVGDVFGLLRADSPVRPGSVRKPVLEAGPGESEYIRYDRAIAGEAERWLRDNAAPGAAPRARPWALFVSFVTPHFPLTVPQEYLDLYPPDSVPLPHCWTPDTWSTHPVLQWKRRIQAIEQPFDEPTLRRAVAVYYGMVTFLDEQIGRVLRALDEAGLASTTRIVYSTDHGEMLGEHGLWWKSVLYEGAAGVPLLLAGPDVPQGKTVATPVSLVDAFPTIVQATGATSAPEDADLPGRSLLEIAHEPDDPTRTVFAEYHASHSSTGSYLLRRGRHKYVHHVGYPPQLFDLAADSDEARDLAADPAHAHLVVAFERVLRTICDPQTVDAAAKADQRRRIDAAGGLQAVLAGGAKFNHTPAPKEFTPAEGGAGG